MYCNSNFTEFLLEKPNTYIAPGAPFTPMVPKHLTRTSWLAITVPAPGLACTRVSSVSLLVR